MGRCPMATEHAPEPPVLVDPATHMRRGELRLWEYRGVVLPAKDGPTRAGVLGLADLEEFVAYVRKHMPRAAILVHQFGLRAIDGCRALDLDDPRLEWRDWD